MSADTSTADTRLSALIVNYESGAFAVRCCESLLREWRRERPRELLELIVVDNASPTDQTPWLERLRELGAKVIVSERNEGYAGGIDRAWEASSGGPRDVVAILNPDLHFLPGSVEVLVRHVVEHPECGAVDPRACIDPLGLLNLPRNPLPTPLEELRCTLARLRPAWCRAYSERRLNTSWEWLLAEGPVDSDMLSGCCLFLRREVVERLGRPLDPRYPLYYEDTDLFRELRRLGYRLTHHGGARVLHHWARSTGIGAAELAGPEEKRRRSRELYFAKHHGPLGRTWVRLLEGLERAWPARLLDRPMHETVDLGAFGEEPLAIDLPRACRFVAEIATSPTWSLAVGVLGEGSRFEVPLRSWEWWFPAPHFVRVLDRDAGEVLGAWRMVKTTPGRTTPLELSETEDVDATRGSGAGPVPSAGRRDEARA